MIPLDLLTERDVLAPYRDAAVRADTVGDKGSKILFGEPIADEECRIDFLTAQPGPFEGLGLPLQTHKHIGAPGDRCGDQGSRGVGFAALRALSASMTTSTLEAAPSVSAQVSSDRGAERSTSESPGT